MTLAPSLAGCGLPKNTPQPFAFIRPCECSSCETFCVKERSSTGGISISVGSLAQDCRLSTPFPAWGVAYCPSPPQGTWAAENSSGDGDGIALCAWWDRQAASKSQDLVGGGGRWAGPLFRALIAVSAHKWGNQGLERG